MVSVKLERPELGCRPRYNLDQVLDGMRRGVRTEGDLAPVPIAETRARRPDSSLAAMWQVVRELARDRERLSDGETVPEIS